MRVPWSDRDWRRVAVYGLGISGRAAAELLCRHGVEVVGVDDRSRVELGADLERLEGLERLGNLEMCLGGGTNSVPATPRGKRNIVEGIDGVVLSPGISPDRPLPASARDRGLPVIAEVELAFHFLTGEVVGITGSNGKSTTTALAGAMLKAAGRRVEVCGNIGEALSSKVVSSKVTGDPDRVFVVELSSYQLEGVDRFRPCSAALLNISHDHLDRHGDLASYRAAKAAIFGRQTAKDLAVLNADDPLVAGTESRSHHRFFSSRSEIGDGCYVSGDVVVETSPNGKPDELFHLTDVPLPGTHNLENAMAAALLARAHGATPADVKNGMRNFRGLPHRLELVTERHGVTWYDDSKGTNPAATERSLEGFEDGKVLIILGGRTKGGDLSRLKRLLERKAWRVYLIGEAAREFARALTPEIAFESVSTLERAVSRAGSEARPGDVVLLSPACSSFDQFPNFAERGRTFKRLVKALDVPPMGRNSNVTPEGGRRNVTPEGGRRNGGGLGTQAGV